MKKLAIALLIVGVPVGAQAQGAVNGLGFTPPSTVPTYNNLGGVLGGVNQGIQSFTISDVKAIPLFGPTGQVDLLGKRANDIIILTTPK